MIEDTCISKYTDVEPRHWYCLAYLRSLHYTTNANAIADY